MIVKEKDGKISKIKIGPKFPDKGEIVFPHNWGTDDVQSFLDKNIDDIKTNINAIDRSDPDKLFNLMKVV